MSEQKLQHKQNSQLGDVTHVQSQFSISFVDLVILAA